MANSCTRSLAPRLTRGACWRRDHRARPPLSGRAADPRTPGGRRHLGRQPGPHGVGVARRAAATPRQDAQVHRTGPQELEDSLEPGGSQVVILDRVRLAPGWRGCGGVGRLLIIRWLRWLYDDPRAVVLKPFPIDLDDDQKQDNAVFRKAMTAVRRTWKSIGFEPFSDDIWVLDPQTGATTERSRGSPNGSDCPTDIAVPTPRRVSTDSAPGPGTTGNNRHQSGKPDTRTDCTTRRRTARSTAGSARETPGQWPSFTPSEAAGL